MLSRLALLTATGLVLLTAASPPANAAGSGRGMTEGKMAAPSSEWSAVKKHRRYYRGHYAYRPARPSGSYSSGDPSLAANGLPYRRPYDLGGCIIDEGYGRFSSCSNR